MGGSPFHGIFSAFVSSKQNTPENAPAGAEESDNGQTGKLAVDIYEQDDYYIIKAPVAGVRMSDLDIEVNENVLVIRGERRQTDNIAADQYYVQECFWGPFSRRVTLPIQIDPRKVRATFNKDGILKILIPKEEKVKIVKITEA